MHSSGVLFLSHFRFKVFCLCRVDMIVGVTPETYSGHATSYYRGVRGSADVHFHPSPCHGISMNSRLNNVEANLEHAEKKINLILETLRYLILKVKTVS